jgi:lipoprotein-anchoring transpeptidase ErfK/SrfK
MHALAACILVAFVSLAGVSPAQPAETWVLVDTPALRVSVMRGEEVLATFDNIAIGSNGATRQKRIADERTPLGEYRISEIRRSSRFHLFLGLDYPTMKDAKRALGENRIDDSEFERIRHALQRGDKAPQDTSLGGNLGFHGIGDGNPDIHARFNWTNGCVALTNDQIDALANLVTVGTPVRIR